MPRIDERKKAAAIAEAAKATSPDQVAAIAKKHGLKSKRTLTDWVKEAAKVDPKRAADGSVPPQPVETEPIDDSEKRKGDAEVVLSILKFGNKLAVKSCATALDLDVSGKEMRQQLELDEDEEEMIRNVAPSLVPGIEKLLDWLEGHSVAVMGVLFVGTVVPRIALLARTAAQVAKLKKEAEEAKEEARAQRPTPSVRVVNPTIVRMPEGETK